VRRYRNMGMPMSRGGGLPSATAVTTAKPSAVSTAVKSKTTIDLKPRPISPVQKEAIKVISESKKLLPQEKEEKIKEVIEDKPPKVITPKPNPPIAPSPIAPPSFLPPPTVSPDKVPGLPIVPPKATPRPPSFQPKPDPKPLPPSLAPAPVNPRPLPPNLAPAPVKPKPPVISPSPPVISPSPPVTIMPSQPRTSIRIPEAIVRSSPRVYSQNRRVVFRPQRLMPPTLNRPPRAAVMKAKPRWKVGKPTSRSFMRRVRPGQFSFQRRGTYFDRRPSNAEVLRLKRRINTLNADALRTKRDHAAERARLEEELRDYRLSPLTQVRNQAKGVFEAVDKASSPFTPSVNGIDGFPQIGEGTSKALAAGMALFAGLFLIGRVE